MRWDEGFISSSPHFIGEPFCVLGFENDGGVKSEGGPASADCGQDHSSGRTQCSVNTSVDQ